MTITVKSGYRDNTPTEDADGIDMSRVYVVEVANEVSSNLELRVLSASGIPSVGDSIAGYPDIKVISKTAATFESGDNYDQSTWTVTLNYSSKNREPDNPLTEEPQFQYGSIQYNEVLDKAYRVKGDVAIDGTTETVDDEEGKPTRPIINCVGDPFDPPVQGIFTNQYVSITLNLSKFDPSWIIEYENTTNKKAQKIAGVQCEPGQARIIQISANNQTYTNSLGEEEEYWVVNYQIEISKRGFIKEILNAGLNKRDDQASASEPFRTVPIKYGDLGHEGDNVNDFISEPTRLYAISGQPIKDPNAESDYIPVRIYFPKDWSTLNIPKNAPAAT